MPKKIRVGIAGYGKAAKYFHIPFLRVMQEFEIVSILQRRSDEAKNDFPGIVIARSIDELVNNKDVDLVVITSSNDTHFEFAVKAMRAGKHVVVDKPFTNTLEEATELIRIAKETGMVLSVYQNRRYASDFITMRKLLSEKLLGDVHEFNATYDRFRPDPIEGAWREEPKPGSGVLYDLGPHLLDQALTLFGHPKFITADIRKQRPHARVDDFFNIWLDYGFLKVILHSGMLVREQGPRYMIQGTKGSFLKSGEDPQEVRLKAGDLPQGDDWGREPSSSDGILHTEINGDVVRRTVPTEPGNFGYYYRNIYNTLVNNAPLLERPEDGYNTIKLINLAFESSEQKKTLPVTGLL
jgi:scyllo-inositol 2-dehydrogenase (NADP+)